MCSNLGHPYTPQVTYKPFESLVHTVYRYPEAFARYYIRIHTHTNSIIAKSSANIDCELEIYTAILLVFMYSLIP